MNILGKTLLLSSFALLSACASDSSNHADSDSTVPADSTPIQVEHADQDIAMLVGSITDAISQGEKLDSAQYDGIASLTDGSQVPLYNSHANKPGEWKVQVEGPSNVAIYNLDQGDLAGEDLQYYVVEYLTAGMTGDGPRMERAQVADSVTETIYEFEKFSLEFRDSLTRKGSMLRMYIEAKEANEQTDKNEDRR